MERKKLTRKEKIRKTQLHKKAERAKIAKKLGVGFIIGGIVFIFIFGSLWHNRNHKIKQEDLVTIEGIVTNELVLKWKRKQGYSMSIVLQEYPTINFKISGFGINALNHHLALKNIDINHPISVDVLKKDFAKINPNKPKAIRVYGLRDDTTDYLYLKSYNWEYRKDRNSIASYLLLGWSFFMFGYGIYLFLSNRKILTPII